ncbi:MAG: DUF1801 domain-containing protein [Fimbriimonadaceae bacterium]
MKIEAETFDEYLAQIPEERQEAFKKLREVINQNIQPGFAEGILYNMPSWFVPKTIYPDGYHCDPKLPLYFGTIASQKNSINWYANFAGDEALKQWFLEEYAKTGHKLDMGKSCIRFKKLETIPYDLIGKVFASITVDKWVSYYESHVKK